MATAPIHLALVSQVDSLSTSILEDVAKAVEVQIREHFAPHWNVGATVGAYQTASGVPRGAWPVTVQRDIGVAGAWSVHDDRDGIPFSLITFDPDTWTLGVSHECLEMLVAPLRNRFIAGPSPEEGQGTVEFLVQVCDPCAAPELSYEVDGVRVSDFVTPAFYEPGAEGPYDHRGAIEAPLRLARGGLMTWRDRATDHWWQQTHFSDGPAIRDLGPVSEEVAADETEQPEPESVETTAPAAEPLQPRRTGDLAGAANDQVSVTDQLGFRDYVTAFATLVTSEETKPPITIGIFGSWGSGKSFLLDHLEKALRDSSFGDTAVAKVHVVRFNAWEYSAAEAIWPSLVRRIVVCLEQAELSWTKRFARRLKRNLAWELRRERGRILGALVAGGALLTVALAGLDFDVTVLGTVIAGLGVTGLLKVVADTFASPLSRWMTSIVADSGYGEASADMSRIKSDLDDLSRRLRMENGRFVVLIDDLDRCEPPEKIIEVLQAINLLLSFDPFVVCLGVDVRVVTKAISHHYDNVLEGSGASGYEYLDKIIQIPFRIPLPNEQEVEAFIAAQLSGAPLDSDGGDTAGTPDAPPTGETAPLAAVVQVSDASQLREVPSAGAAVGVAFSDYETKSFEALAPFLEPNPRHLKRLVNVYRLVRSLAIVRHEASVLDDPKGTIQLLALAAQWPYTLAFMLQELDVIADAEAKGASWPASDALIHLYEAALPRLDRERQVELDRDPAHLFALLHSAEGTLSWKALVTLRRYVINFNPAVEEELRRAQVPAEAASGASAAGSDRGERDA